MTSRLHRLNTRIDDLKERRRRVMLRELREGKSIAIKARLQTLNQEISRLKDEKEFLHIARENREYLRKLPRTFNMDDDFFSSAQPLGENTGVAWSTASESLDEKSSGVKAESLGNTLPPPAPVLTRTMRYSDIRTCPICTNGKKREHLNKRELDHVIRHEKNRVNYDLPLARLEGIVLIV